MAMTKEQQREAAKRIMAKLGPLTPEEEKTYEILTKRPEQYQPPDEVTGERTCGLCGAKFQRIPGNQEAPEKTALEQFSDHMATHNPSPLQWAEAHKLIMKGKEKQKEKESANTEPK